MGVYIPKMEKPKDCSECILADKHLNGLYEAKYYCRLEADNCPLIEIDLVRCGECRWWHEHGYCTRGMPTGESIGWIRRTHDDFCSYGERKPISDERLEFWEKVYKEESR